MESTSIYQAPNPNNHHNLDIESILKVNTHPQRQHIIETSPHIIPHTRQFYTALFAQIELERSFFSPQQQDNNNTLFTTFSTALSTLKEMITSSSTTTSDPNMTYLADTNAMTQIKLIMAQLGATNEQLSSFQTYHTSSMVNWTVLNNYIRYGGPVEPSSGMTSSSLGGGGMGGNDGKDIDKDKKRPIEMVQSCLDNVKDVDSRHYHKNSHLVGSGSINKNDNDKIILCPTTPQTTLTFLDQVILAYQFDFGQCGRGGNGIFGPMGGVGVSGGGIDNNQYHHHHPPTLNNLHSQPNTLLIFSPLLLPTPPTPIPPPLTPSVFSPNGSKNGPNRNSIKI